MLRWEHTFAADLLGPEASRLLGSLIGEYDRRQGWAADGMASMTDWVAARLALARSTASAWVGAAARLEQLPELRALAAPGGLSFDQLVPLLALAATRLFGPDWDPGSRPSRPPTPPSRN
ncbi:MAG TPA: DUF222 domain-containing protein [Acidimicrobiales bacterium]